MAYEGQNLTITMKSLEDHSGCQYHAVAFNDSLLANNGKEACGILMNKPASGDHATVGFQGVLKYAAGAAVNAGVRLTVTTSGWLVTAAESGAYVVGFNSPDAVTSGSVGVGIFGFTNPSIIPASGM